MKNPSDTLPSKCKHPAVLSPSECFKLSDFKKAWDGATAPQSFNLLLITRHPDSTDENAGEVVRVPAEFMEGAVLVDLSGVTRIDSCGLALLLEAMQRMAARGGRLILIGVRDEVRRVLETAKLDLVFQICPSREIAVADQGHFLTG